MSALTDRWTIAHHALTFTYPTTARRATYAELQKARESKGLSIKDAAKAANVDPSRWQKWETGYWTAEDDDVTFSEGMRICEALEIEPGSLLGLDAVVGSGKWCG